jgi:hypothetical protein
MSRDQRLRSASAFRSAQRRFRRCVPFANAAKLYTVVYGWGRFSFEFFRGDVDRPYALGFSPGPLDITGPDERHAVGAALLASTLLMALMSF